MLDKTEVNNFGKEEHQKQHCCILSMLNRPFRNLEKGTGENAAHSDRLTDLLAMVGNQRNPLRFVDKGTACILVAPRCNLWLFSIYLHLSRVA